MFRDSNYLSTDPNPRLFYMVREPNYLSTDPNPTIFICSGNLIGLQLPDDNGEVLYLDPNDPAAQILLQEAGITMGRFPHTDHLMINYFMEKILFKSNFNLFENQKSNCLKLKSLEWSLH